MISGERMGRWWRAAKREPRRGRFHLARLLVCVAILCGWRWLDPGHLDELLTDHASRMLDQSLSAFYPQRLCPSCEPYSLGRDRILVALVDDEFVERTGHRRPVAADYAQLILRLAEARADTLVFDILLTPEAFPRAELDQLIEAIRRAQATGTRIIMPQLAHGRTPAYACEDATQRPSGVVDKSLSCAATAVAALSWRSPQREIFYPLYVDDPGAEVPITPSLAWATWLVMAGRTGAMQAPRGREGADDMMLIWGQAEQGEGCIADDEDPPAGLWRHIRAALYEPLFAEEPPEAARCTWLRTRSVGRLLAASPEEIARDAANRVVFIGLAGAGNPDIINPPLGGPLPGAYLHATALENLLTFGAGHHVVYRTPQAHGHSINYVFATLAAVMFWTVRFVRREPADDHHSPAGQPNRPRRLVAGELRRFAIDTTLKLLITAILLPIAAKAFDIAVANAIAVLVTFLVLELLLDFVARIFELAKQ